MQEILFLLNDQGVSQSLKFSLIFVAIFVVIFIFVLKGFSLWFASKHNDKAWFVAILIINTFGLLELIYLFFFEKDKKTKNYLLSKLAKFKKS